MTRKPGAGKRLIESTTRAKGPKIPDYAPSHTTPKITNKPKAHVLKMAKGKRASG